MSARKQRKRLPPIQRPSFEDQGAFAPPSTGVIFSALSQIRHRRNFTFHGCPQFLKFPGNEKVDRKVR